MREQTEDGISQIVLTSQLLDVKGSDTFSAISSASSLNGGETWSELVPQKGFARWQLGEQMEETICDFVLFGTMLPGSFWGLASQFVINTVKS